MAGDEHDATDVDEEQNSLHVDGAGEREVDPLPRREFGGCSQEHAEEQDKEHGLEEFLKHVAHADAGSGAFGGREFQTHAEHDDSNGRDEDEAELDVPGNPCLT